MGVSVGAVFTIYAPLDPEVFSIGGIGLAIGMLLLATQYHRLLNLDWFFRISMTVELVMLAAITVILTLGITSPSAIAVYVGYQLTFVFGSYLVRCETLLLAENRWLTRVDVAKQSGYLVGMALAWLGYRIMESWYGVTEKTAQVVSLHYALLLIELTVILAFWAAFRQRRADDIG